MSIRLDGEHDAGACRLAVEEDRAGAAHAMLAAHVGPGEAKTVTQEVA
jgi:hypothetical protein